MKFASRRAMVLGIWILGTAAALLPGCDKPDQPDVVVLNRTLEELTEREDVRWIRMDANRVYIGMTGEDADPEAVCAEVAEKVFRETKAGVYAIAVNHEDPLTVYGQVYMEKGRILENTFSGSP